tara:strand:+ start:1969 stop:2289 length:321 start_codon:yes stop_codon:yes gene_type:complete
VKRFSKNIPARENKFTTTAIAIARDTPTLLNFQKENTIAITEKIQPILGIKERVHADTVNNVQNFKSTIPNKYLMETTIDIQTNTRLIRYSTASSINSSIKITSST